MTLAFIGANSKLLDVVSVADSDTQEHFGQYFEAGVLSSFLPCDFVRILKLKFGQDFEAKFSSRF